MSNPKRVITLTITRIQDATGHVEFYYHWTLQSQHHFWCLPISGKTYSWIWAQLVIRADDFRCLPEQIISEGRDGSRRSIFESEFHLY